jgi:hypothetical protein
MRIAVDPYLYGAHTNRDTMEGFVGIFSFYDPQQQVAISQNRTMTITTPLIFGPVSGLRPSWSSGPQLRLVLKLLAALTLYP